MEKLDPNMNLGWILPPQDLRRLKLLAKQKKVSIQVLVSMMVDKFWEERKEG
jgi:hypothetical protein